MATDEQVHRSNLRKRVGTTEKIKARSSDDRAFHFANTSEERWRECEGVEPTYPALHEAQRI